MWVLSVTAGPAELGPAGSGEPIPQRGCGLGILAGPREQVLGARAPVVPEPPAAEQFWLRGSQPDDGVGTLLARA